jgi:hypothetical protein
MKKVIILFVFAIWSFTSFAQDSFPLIEENKTWNVLAVALVGSNFWDTTFTTITYRLSGDTVIGSNSYLKLYETREETPTEWDLMGFMREENKKVWLKEVSEPNELLMYDLSANQGDTLRVWVQSEEEFLVVDSITEIEINGEMRTKYCLSFYNYHETWIDGIGSDKGIVWSGTTGIVGGWFRFLCSSLNDELIYINPNYTSCYLITDLIEFDEKSVKIFPNPATDILNIEGELEIESISLHNLNGQLIKHFNANNRQLNISDISSGMYFLKVTCNNEESTIKVIVEN